MKQFLLPQYFSGEPHVLISGEDYHYLVHVRRVKKSQVFPGIDSRGISYELEVAEISRENVTLNIMKMENSPGNGPNITLFQCIPKGKRMDTIIRQCVETGVYRVIPVMSKNTIVSLSEERKPVKLKRWEKIAGEALQQSGSTTPLTIAPVTDFVETAQFIDEFDLKLFFHEQPLANKGLHQYLFGDTNNIALFIGPEGGLSEKEAKQLRGWGFLPVWLGNRILRVDTAALFAISSVQILLLEKDAWKNR